MLILDHGIVRNSRVKVELKPGIAHGALTVIHAIIVHQTDSSSAQQTLNAYAVDGRGDGTHFLIDKDGTIYQTARLDQKCWHIGKIKARCYEEHNCVGAEKTFYANLEDQARKEHKFSEFVTKGYAHETAKVPGHPDQYLKPYPARYPTNEDAIGIELVGLKLGDKDDSPFEKPTDLQQASTDWLIGELLITLKLRRTDIFRHPTVSRKSKGEAADVKF
jgi:N-acetyl-anhydromuramyl-L-alanine amidase AmpD